MSVDLLNDLDRHANVGCGVPFRKFIRQNDVAKHRVWNRAIDLRRKHRASVDRHRVALAIVIESHAPELSARCFFNDLRSAPECDLKKSDGVIDELCTPVDRRACAKPAHARVGRDFVGDYIESGALPLRIHV